MTLAIHIPDGNYLTKLQVAEHYGVIHQTVQQWFDKNWLPHIFLPGLGYIVNERDLATFTPPGRGRRSGIGRHKPPIAEDAQ